MKDYRGVIIEESLKDKRVLNYAKIVSTTVEQVTKEHQTPQLKQWTLHTVKISNSEAERFAGKLSKALRGGTLYDNWYADFKNEMYHFIVFPNKVFKIERANKKQYDDAKYYGISLGIPEYQVDFHPEVEEWER